MLGIHGYLPAVVKTEEEQVTHCVMLLDRYENDLDKFIYLMGLLVSFIEMHSIFKYNRAKIQKYFHF